MSVKERVIFNFKRICIYKFFYTIVSVTSNFYKKYVSFSLKKCEVDFAAKFLCGIKLFESVDGSKCESNRDNLTDIILKIVFIILQARIYKLPKRACLRFKTEKSG